MINIPKQDNIISKNTKTWASEVLNSLTFTDGNIVTKENVSGGDVESFMDFDLPHLNKKGRMVIVEILQNILRHQDPNNKDKSIFSLSKEGDKYIVTFSNYFLNVRDDDTKISTKEELIDTMDEVNRLTLSELKIRYKEKLQTTEISKKGGAGLGFLDIAKKLKGLYPKEISEDSTKNIKVFNYSIKDTDIPGILEYIIKIDIPFIKKD